MSCQGCHFEAEKPWLKVPWDNFWKSWPCSELFTPCLTRPRTMVLVLILALSVFFCNFAYALITHWPSLVSSENRNTKSCLVLILQGKPQVLLCPDWISVVCHRSLNCYAALFLGKSCQLGVRPLSRLVSYSSLWMFVALCSFALMYSHHQGCALPSSLYLCV